MKEKILVVSWSVYPSPTGSAVIMDNIASTFSDAEMVLVGDGKDLPPPDKGASYPKIYYMNPNPGFLKRVQKYSRWMNSGKITRQIEAIAKSEKCTSILAVFPDEFYMNAAYKVSKKLNLPFYTWFHNTYLDNRKGLLKMVAKRLQPRFFDHARTNFVMSDGMNDYYKKAYPKLSFTTLTHGFEIPKVEYKAFTPNKEIVRFLFSGSFNEACREATVRQLKTILKNPNHHVHLFTGTSIADFEAHGIGGSNVHHEGFVTLEELRQRFVEFDIMLLPHGFDGTRTDVEYDTMFPTRTIPILYSNRPILAHSPKGAFLTDFLRQHDCAEIVDEKDEDALDAAIQRLLNDEQRREHLIKNALKTAQIFDLNRVSKVLRETIYG